MLSRWIPTEAQLVRSLGKACMEAGDRLERRGEVHEYTLEEKDDRLTARARFYDQALAYGTYVDLLKSQRIEYFCTCKYQGKMPVCPHASALLLHAVRKEEATVLGEHFATDSQMERVMRHFQRLRMDAPDKDEGMEIRPRIRLVPTFRFDESNREGMSDDDRVFPVVGARIGLEGGKLYNVQSFPSLFKAFDERKKETYGSGLVIAHDADLLDAVSRTFFTALREQSELDASCIRLYGFSASASLSGMGTLRLRGAQFDVLFDCFADQGLIPAREKNHQDTAFGTQMPTLQMEIVHKDGYAELDMHDFSGILFFHTGKYRYMRQQREGIMFVWRVTEAFERTIQPLQVKSDDTSLVIVDEDLPRFVGGVVPAISAYVEVLDPGNVLEAAEQYKADVGERLNIVEGNFSCNIAYIANYIRGYAARNGKTPVVFVDYLQILQPTETRQGTKETVDLAVTELKRLSRAMSIPIVAISSINRANYLTPVDFESLKESGGIEYTADVILGLQLQILNDRIFQQLKSSDTIKKRELVKDAKAQSPRKIELVCLKNRYGEPSYSVGFEYKPQYDLFTEEVIVSPWEQAEIDRRAAEATKRY